MESSAKPILVMGGGMAGLTTALEAAEAGCARRPAEVSATARDATGAALKALQCSARGH